MDAAQRDELLRLADQLANLETRRRANVRRLYELYEDEGKLWASVALAIADEKDAAGKPRYSNDVKRRAAVRLALGENAQYQHLRDEFRPVRQTVDEIAVETMRLKDRRAVLAVAAGMVPEPSELPASSELLALLQPIRQRTQGIPEPSEPAQNPSLEDTLADFQEQLDRLEDLMMDIAVALRVREAKPEIDMRARVQVDKDERAAEPREYNTYEGFGSKLRFPDVG